MYKHTDPIPCEWKVDYVENTYIETLRATDRSEKKQTIRTNEKLLCRAK